MTFRLAARAIEAGYSVESFASVGSTNTVAIEHARAGGSGRTWFVSKQQETGRGRRGRDWETQNGNLAATLLLFPQSDIKVAATLGFVAGLALADALDQVAPHLSLKVDANGGSSAAGGRFELKWPNDLLVAGAKLSGILLESTMLDSHRYAVAIGIGVNVVAHPAQLPYAATSLAALGVDCNAETLFEALSRTWIGNWATWDGGRGLSNVRRRWLERAAGVGSEVAVKVEGRVVLGIFETIDDDCRFVIRSSDGTRIAIAAGDVHFGAVASAAIR